MTRNELERIIPTARASLEAEKQRSAWGRGVTVYAMELLEDLGEAVDGGLYIGSASRLEGHVHHLQQIAAR